MACRSIRAASLASMSPSVSSRQNVRIARAYSGVCSSPGIKAGCQVCKVTALRSMATQSRNQAGIPVDRRASGDGLDGVGAPEGLRARLRQAEMPDLAVGDQLLYCPGDVLDGHVRVDAVLVKQVDPIGLQALERSVDYLPDVLGAAVESVALAGDRVDVECDLVAMTTWSRTGARASPRSSSLVNGP